MSERLERPGTEDAPEREAAAWIVALSDPALAPGERERLRRERDRWLQAEPAHHEAYRTIERNWNLLRQAALHRGTLGPAPAKPRRRRWRAAAAAALLVVLGLVLLGIARFWIGDPALLLEADLRTAPGELRTVELVDSRRLTLGSDSAVAFEASAPAEGDAASEAPRLRLLKGRVALAPAPAEESPPPAVVSAPGVEVRGGHFQVERDREGLSVTAVDGLVRVSFDSRPDEAAVMVAPGERLSLPASGGPRILEPVELDETTAWQDGRLLFERTPLYEVVATLNRHRRQTIVIADAALAGREFSGSFRLDSLDGADRRLATELQASRLALPPFVSLLY